MIDLYRKEYDVTPLGATIYVADVGRLRARLDLPILCVWLTVVYHMCQYRIQHGKLNSDSWFIVRHPIQWYRRELEKEDAVKIKSLVNTEARNGIA